MVINKICIDCGKQFSPKSYIDDDIVVCEDCVIVLKRKFWSAMKIGMRQNNNISKDDKQNKQNKYWENSR